jgi:hypothetical protein
MLQNKVIKIQFIWFPQQIRIFLHYQKNFRYFNLDLERFTYDMDA